METKICTVLSLAFHTENRVRYAASPAISDEHKKTVVDLFYGKSSPVLLLEKTCKHTELDGKAKVEKKIKVYPQTRR